jgi:[ribosomal protein S18]-alanine N-acetyltransferase
VIEVRPLGDPEVAFVSARLPLHRLGAEGGEYLVAWDGEDPVGHAHVAWEHEPPELQDVFVPEPLRSRGIGSELSRAFEAQAAERGHLVVGLEVAETNSRAIALYERLGYVRTADPPKRVVGTVQLRTGPLEVDDTLLRYEKRLQPE